MKNPLRNYDPKTVLQILNTENCPTAKWCKQVNVDKPYPTKSCSSTLGYGIPTRGGFPNALFIYFNDTDGKYECNDGDLGELNGGGLMHELLHNLGIFIIIRFNIIKF